MDKSKRIKQEYERISGLYKNLPKNQRELAEGLIANAAFMQVTLEELQAQITEEGAVIEQKNGNGFLSKMEHPAQKSYNTMVNRYNATIKVLGEMLPPVMAESKLAAFLNE